MTPQDYTAIAEMLGWRKVYAEVGVVHGIRCGEFWEDENNRLVRDWISFADELIRGPLSDQDLPAYLESPDGMMLGLEWMTAEETRLRVSTGRLPTYFRDLVSAMDRHWRDLTPKAVLAALKEICEAR